MHSFITSIKAARREASKRFKNRAAGESGAFDIASIIIGVVLLGILVGGIIASTSGLVPWAQDKSAKQDLSAIVTSQQVYKAQSTDRGWETIASYGTLAKLTAAPASLLSPELATDATFAADADATNYWAVKKGGSGTWFGVNEEEITPIAITPAPAAGATAATVLAAYKTANT